MMLETLKNSWEDRREYPRIQANCPARFKVEGENVWQDATLIDYSATGVCIQCDELLLKGTRLQIDVLQGGPKNIPNFSADGVVVRFSLDDDHRFQIGCQFNNAIRSLIDNPQK